jgi:hypothetical protein
MYEKLLLVQKEIGAIKKDQTNPHFKNSYFDINSLLATVKPVLNKHGLIVMQLLTHIEGKPALETIIMGDEGGRISAITPLPEGLDAMKMGAAITYFRRYAIVSLLALEAEDNDGSETFREIPYDSDEPTSKSPRR